MKTLLALGDYAMLSASTRLPRYRALFRPDQERVELSYYIRELGLSHSNWTIQAALAHQTMLRRLATTRRTEAARRVLKRAASHKLVAAAREKLAHDSRALVIAAPLSGVTIALAAALAPSTDVFVLKQPLSSYYFQPLADRASHHPVQIRDAKSILAIQRNYPSQRVIFTFPGQSVEDQAMSLERRLLGRIRRISHFEYLLSGNGARVCALSDTAAAPKLVDLAPQPQNVSTGLSATADFLASNLNAFAEAFPHLMLSLGALASPYPKPELEEAALAAAKAHCDATSAPA
jgi:hypothetical protein